MDNSIKSETKFLEKKNFIFLEPSPINNQPIDMLRDLLIAKGYKISRWADTLLNNYNFIPNNKKETVTLLKITVSQLGFTNGAYYRDICKRILQLNLDLCLMEDVLSLCIQYKGELLNIAMTPIMQEDDNLDILTIGYNKRNELELGDTSGNPGSFWPSNSTFVVRCK